VSELFFTKKYYEDEVIDGFYVCGLNKACWAAQMDVLSDLKRVCDKYDITWYADMGTMLGTVRHGGFVPWDDDLDIVMKRKDLEKFKAVALKELPEGYQLLSIYNENTIYWEYITRIVKGAEFSIEEEDLIKCRWFPFPVGIDIFCLDYVPPNETDEYIIHTIGTLGQNIVDAEEEGCPIDVLEPLISKHEELTGVKIDRDKNLKQQIYIINDRMFGMYSEDESEYVALMSDWVDSKGVRQYPKNLYSSSVVKRYGNTTIPVPIGYDGILSMEYGKQRYLKCIRSGGSHEYPYYTEKKNVIESMIGQPPFEYRFNKEDLDNTERPSYRRLDQAIFSYVELINLVNATLKEDILSGRYDEARVLMVDMQELSMNIGQRIDSEDEKGAPAVRILEMYCEALYMVFEALGNDSPDKMNLHQKLETLFGDFVNCVREIYNSKKQVVFIPYKSEHFKQLESLWKSYSNSSEWEVIVMPIPWFYRTPLGRLEDMTYDANKYPENVTITPFNEYDLKSKHPDIIFIQNPYDNANFSTSVYPAFFSSELKKYTEELVYIPYFKTSEIPEDDERGFISMNAYVTVPGVMHADRVIVQSEAMRGSYIKKLCEFAGEDTKGIWETKISFDETLFEVFNTDTNNYAELPAENLFSLDGTRKKVVVYSMNIGTLFVQGENAVRRIRDAIKVFKANIDKVLFVWAPDEDIKDNFFKISPQLWEAYSEIKDQFISEGWGIFDDSWDVLRLSSIGDAYYGDIGRLAHEFNMKNKPVLLQNFEIN